jgi:hypothetical protein
MYFKTHKATRGVVNFYSAGAVTRDRRFGLGLPKIVSKFTKAIYAVLNACCDDERLNNMEKKRVCADTVCVTGKSSN